jgi:hypothetical protein
MKEERVVEDYRNHKLLAMLHNGKYMGRAWDAKSKLLTEINGADIASILTVLRDYVDSSFSEKANSRTSSPDVQEYVRAFQRMIGDLPESYLAMLKAHYRAPDRTMTATQLSKAGKYKSWSSANLHYGLLGKRLYEEMPMQLETLDDGTPIYTFALATQGDRSEEESHWQWVMRPEVAAAIEQLGLHK